MDPKTIETDARGAQPGEVVQINPEKHPKFAGCFAVVDQLRRWGVVADIPMPGDPNAIIPVRLAWADFARVGMACWMRAGRFVVQVRRADGTIETCKKGEG